MLLQEYNLDWVNQFNAIQQVLDTAIGKGLYRIEHIGSTAVAKLAAKPIIDIDIIYTTDIDLKNITKTLISLGYYHNGDQGIKHREVFKRDTHTHHAILDTISHHLYVCLKDSPGLERHLLSRDYLRKNEWARNTYQALKYKAAEKANQDKKQYQILKESYVNDLIDKIITLEKEHKQ